MARARHGWTLMELLLVLAILVIIAGLSLPALLPAFESQRLARSADQIRAVWGRTRVAAMKSGQIHLFRFTPGGREYMVDVWYGELDEATAPGVPGFGDSPAGAMAPASAGAVGPGGVAGAGSATQQVYSRDIGKPQQLPEDIVFVDAQVQDDTRALKVAMEFGASQNQASPTGQTWSRPILFYPDGTTSDAQIFITNPRDRYVMIELRGLTGISQASDLLTREDLP